MGNIGSREEPVPAKEPAVEREAYPGSKWRNLAAVEARLRKHCISNSRIALARKNAGRAQILSEQSRVHADRMNAYNQKAAVVIFKHYNQGRSLAECDLHGLFVHEALVTVREHLAKCRKERIKNTVIITGRGIHSRNGISRLKPAIEEFCIRERIRATSNLPNHGCISVELDVEEKAGFVDWWSKLVVSFLHCWKILPAG